MIARLLKHVALSIAGIFVYGLLVLLAAFDRQGRIDAADYLRTCKEGNLWL